MEEKDTCYCMNGGVGQKDGAVETFIYRAGHLEMHLGWADLLVFFGQILHRDTRISLKRQKCGQMLKPLHCNSKPSQPRSTAKCSTL